MPAGPAPAMAIFMARSIAPDDAVLGRSLDADVELELVALLRRGLDGGELQRADLGDLRVELHGHHGAARTFERGLDRRDLGELGLAGIDGGAHRVLAAGARREEAEGRWLADDEAELHRQLDLAALF